MDVRQVVGLAEAGVVGRDVVGGKARTLAKLAGIGLPVPPGFVVTAAALAEPDGLDSLLAGAARQVGGARFAVRSSGAAEDLPEASYAGLYETFLNVSEAELADAVRRCFAAAASARVRVYRDRRGGADAALPGMAVLVQQMVDAAAAGVAFTAHPVTGRRDQLVVTAVRGLGDPLVSGAAVGEEWTLQAGAVTRSRPASDGRDVLDAGRASEVAQLARRVADRLGGPQDVEWAIDTADRLWLLQARPMTALPDPVSWTPPGPGLWMRNFRLGEWLPEAVTPLFATWLLPQIEDGYLDAMHTSIGVRVPFRYALVNGWYYNATPVPSFQLLSRLLREGRGRTMTVLFNALIQVSRNPVAADRAALGDLYKQWRERQLPRYQQLVSAGRAQVDVASSRQLAELVDQVAREAGTYLWFLAIVGGSAWKMEDRLTRFCRQHLSAPIARAGGSVQVLLRGLAGTTPAQPAHAVHSVDWYHPLAADLPTGTLTVDSTAEARHRRLAEERAAAETDCRQALAERPRLLARFDALLEVAQRYAAIREEQARDFTLGWPLLRTCAYRLGQHLTAEAIIAAPDDVFFCARAELDAHLHRGDRASLAEAVARRRGVWQRQRRLTAPLTLGHPPRLVGDLIERTVQRARGPQPAAEGAITGHPASAGRATGPVRYVDGPEEFAAFGDGEILVAKATAPAWTPLFARAAAVVTDGGTLAAHASLVAREYGIPAVVGTGDATSRLHTGQIVTVDGTAGTVTPVAR
jgi:pyruvate,water dikinase